jgi:hypothetical protein
VVATGLKKVLKGVARSKGPFERRRSVDIYECLARKLDGLPNGFPRTETGVELKMLRRIFHPEEAEVFIKMTLLPKTAAKIAERLGKPVEGMKEFLDNMVRRGQIVTSVDNGERTYALMPFLIGVFDAQRNVLDKELAEMFQEYYPTLVATVGGFGPALGRVVPIGINVPAEMKIHRSDDVRQMIEEGKAFNVKICNCRNGKAILGSPCKKHIKENYCLAISRDPNAFTGPISAIMG